MKARLVAALIVLSVSACAASPQGKVAPGDKALVGTYEMGDGLGVCMSVELREDGSLRGRHCGGGHRGERDRKFRGTWRQSGTRLEFMTPREDIGTSEIFFLEGDPAFIELTHKRTGQEPYWPFAFRRQEQ